MQLCFVLAESGNNAAGPTADAESSDARTAAVSSDAPQAGASRPPPNATNTPSQTFRGVRATLGHMVSTVQLLQPGVSAVWKRAFVVDMLVTLQVPHCLPHVLLLLACVFSTVMMSPSDGITCCMLLNIAQLMASQCEDVLYVVSSVQSRFSASTPGLAVQQLRCIDCHSVRIGHHC